MASRGDLLKRFLSLSKSWPVVPERRGRDLGEFLQTKFAAKFKEMAGNDATVGQARRDLECLETLRANKHREMYRPSRGDTPFTGDMGSSWGFKQLSSKSQEQVNAKGFFSRLAKQTKHMRT